MFEEAAYYPRFPSRVNIRGDDEKRRVATSIGCAESTMRRGLLAAGLLIIFLGLFLMVALRKQPPDIPADGVHLPLRGRQQECMSCHGPDGVKPRGPNHPLGHDCRRCHFEVGEVR